MSITTITLAFSQGDLPASTANLEHVGKFSLHRTRAVAARRRFGKMMSRYRVQPRRGERSSDRRLEAGVDISPRSVSGGIRR